MRCEILRAKRSSFLNRSIGFLVESDLGLDELEGDDFFDLLVEDLVDLAHPAPAQLLDDLVTAGEDGPPREIIERGRDRLCIGEKAFREVGRKRGRALAAKSAVRLVFSLAGGANHR